MAQLRDDAQRELDLFEISGIIRSGPLTSRSRTLRCGQLAQRFHASSVEASWQVSYESLKRSG